MREWNYNTKLKLNRDHSIICITYDMIEYLKKKKKTHTQHVTDSTDKTYTMGWVVPSSQVVKNSKIILFYLTKKMRKFNRNNNSKA